MASLRQYLYTLLRWSEKYTKTDMVYLFHSGWWGNLGSVSVSLFSFILYVAFAHFLSKETYGTYQYLISLAAIVGNFTLTGMNTAVAQAVARGYEGVFKKALVLQMRWNIIPLLGAWGFALWYALNGNSTLAGGLFLIGIFTPLINTLNTYGGIISGKKDFRRGFLFNFYANIPYYSALLLVMYFYDIPLLLLLANLLSQVAATYLLYKATLRIYPPNDQVDENTLRYGAHLSFLGALGGIVSQLDNVLVFHYLGAVELAIYSFATAIPERLSGLFKFLPTAALPKFAVKSDAEIRQSIFAKTGIGLLAGAVVAGVYILLANIFFSIFFPTYMEAVPYSQLYALVIVASVGSIFPTALTARRRIKHLYVLNITTPVLQLGVQWVCLLQFGLWGLISAKIFFWFFSGALALLLLFVGKTQEEEKILA